MRGGVTDPFSQSSKHFYPVHLVEGRRVGDRFSLLPIAWGEYIIRVRTVKGNGVGAGAAPFGFKGAGFEVEVG